MKTPIAFAQRDASLRDQVRRSISIEIRRTNRAAGTASKLCPDFGTEGAITLPRKDPEDRAVWKWKIRQNSHITPAVAIEVCHDRHKHLRLPVWSGERCSGAEGSVTIAQQDPNDALVVALEKIDFPVAVEISCPHDNGKIAA